MAEENRWKPSGEEEEEEEEIDETVSHMGGEKSLVVLTPSGIQTCQRRRSFRHRSEQKYAYSTGNDRLQESGKRQSDISGLEVRVCTDAATYHL